MGNSPKLPVYENARQGTAIPFPPLHAVSCLAFFNSDCYTISFFISNVILHIQQKTDKGNETLC